MMYIHLLFGNDFILKLYSIKIARGGKTMDATIILYNGTILTVDGRFSIAQSVAIKSEKILAVGSNEEMRRYQGDQTEMVDLQGKTVIPGLIDSHIHGSWCAKEIGSVQLQECRTIKDLLRAIEARARVTEPGQWVVASSAWH